MNPRMILTAVLAALAALLGPHLLLQLAYSLAVLVIGVLCFGIASVLVETRWPRIPGALHA